MKGCIITAGVLLLIALFIVGKLLGWGLTYVQVTKDAFVPGELQIYSGDSVYFQNKTGGGNVAFCLGQNGICASNAPGPADLRNHAVILGVAETHPVIFDHQGTYKITSPQNKGLSLIVHVNNNTNGEYGGGAGSSGGGSGTGTGGGDDSSGGSSGGDGGGDGGGSSGGGGGGGGE